MNNDELKKKMVEVVNQWHMLQKRDMNGHTIWLANDSEKLADALIAAGIGDVKKAQRRAEVAEKALKSRAMCHVLGYFPNEISGLESCIQEVYEAWIYQAEKELAEERKDD